MVWLDPLEAAMMTAEVLSRPLNIGAVLIMSPPADASPDYVDDLHHAAVSGRDPLDPRLHRYPHRGPDTFGGWVWRRSETVDLSQHCRRLTLASGGGRAELWRVISQLHAEPLDRSRPMWVSYLIDGLPGGRFALYLQIHHTVMDGVAASQMIAGALSSDPERRSMPQFYASHDRERAVVPTARQPLPIPNPLRLIRSTTSTVASAATLAERAVIGEVSDVVAGLTGDTTVSMFAAPYTPFNGRLGHERTFAADTWPKPRIRTLQDASGTTGNDVVTAVIAGALRRWLLGRGRLPEHSLVAICPITGRSRAHAANDLRGNMFGAWLCPLGTDLPDPLERLDLIHRSMSEGKRRVADRGPGASLLLLAPAIGPTVLLPMLPFGPRVRRGYNLPISHVPGPPTEMYWNGAHIEGIYPVSAVYDGQALNVTTCSYADRIGFGFIAGRNAVPDVDTLIALTEQSLAELEEALGLHS